MILCYTEILFLHHTGPTGARPPHVSAGPRAPPVVPALGRAHGRGLGGRAQARGGCRGHGRARGGGQVRGAAVLLHETYHVRDLSC